MTFRPEIQLSSLKANKKTFESKVLTFGHLASFKEPTDHSSNCWARKNHDFENTDFYKSFSILCRIQNRNFENKNSFFSSRTILLMVIGILKVTHDQVMWHDFFSSFFSIKSTVMQKYGKTIPHFYLRTLKSTIFCPFRAVSIQLLTVFVHFLDETVSETPLTILKNHLIWFILFETDSNGSFLAMSFRTFAKI